MSAQDQISEQIELVLQTARIEKRGYSVHPWRIVSKGGREIYMPEVIDHPDCGRTVISMPLSFPRKRDAVDYLQRYATAPFGA